MRTRIARMAATLAGGALAIGAAVAPLAAQRRDSVVSPTGPWPIKTREHVDLWLHGYALLGEDTATVPLFRTGYRDSLIVLRNQRGTFTALDSARSVLQAGLVKTPALEQGQFYALHFGTLEEARQVLTLTEQARGVPQRASSREGAAMVALGATYFPTPEALAWGTRFTGALVDESARFFRGAWLDAQRARTPTLARIDSLWRTRWFPALRPFLRGTQQRYGEILLSPVVEGEGRTIVLDPQKGPTVVVGYPDSPARAEEALYAIAHEAAGTLAARAVTENITPRQATAGLGARLQSPAAVRAGYLLLQKALPGEAEGYARFYLRLMRKPVPASGAGAALVAATPLPADIVESMTSLLNSYFEGI
ncbi:MAG: hypothetical protein MUF21_05275 [Gemmatimonadaceae bacterium]|jgi:hypothetical protein|nr:hypothetical protein [Gemmatimonadaceae bacterium]